MSLPRIAYQQGLLARWVSVHVDEAILKCVVKCGLLRRAELDKMRYFLIHWRRLIRLLCTKTVVAFKIWSMVVAACGASSTH